MEARMMRQLPNARMAGLMLALAGGLAGAAFSQAPAGTGTQTQPKGTLKGTQTRDQNIPAADGKPASFKRDQKLNLWMQVYNLGVDDKTHKPSATVEYNVVNLDTLDGFETVSRTQVVTPPPVDTSTRPVTIKGGTLTQESPSPSPPSAPSRSFSCLHHIILRVTAFSKPNGPGS